MTSAFKSSLNAQHCCLPELEDEHLPLWTFLFFLQIRITVYCSFPSCLAPLFFASREKKGAKKSKMAAQSALLFLLFFFLHLQMYVECCLRCGRENFEPQIEPSELASNLEPSIDWMTNTELAFREASAVNWTMSLFLSRRFTKLSLLEAVSRKN